MRLSHLSTDNGKCPKNGAKMSNLDLGTPPWALGIFAVSIHVLLSQPKMRLEQCSLRQRMQLEKEFAVNSMPNFRVGYYTPLSWPTQMCASQSCPLTMPFVGGPSKSFWRSLLDPILSLKLQS